MSHNTSTPIRSRADGAMINNNYTFFFAILDNLMIIRFDDLNLMTMSYHRILLEYFRKFSFFLKVVFFFPLGFSQTFIASQERFQSLLLTVLVSLNNHQCILVKRVGHI